MRYIHQLPTWPEFTWDDSALAARLAAVRHRQGLLLGRMQSIGFQLRAEANLEVMTTTVVTSSAIEGEALDAAEVRSSIASRLGLHRSGLPVASRDVEGAVEVMFDATTRFNQPLTKERLFGWHAALFPTGRSGLRRVTVGAWRTPASGPMQVISGPIGSEKVHFEAPAASRLEREMAHFLGWFNEPPVLDPVTKAAIAHFWFVTIHPFEDGNGRIARAIADLALARADGIEQRFYSMSAQIEAERRDYYGALESSQRGSLDITTWLTWFLDCLDRAIAGADKALAVVMHKADTWRRLRRHNVNERQRKVVNRLLDGFDGKLTSSKYAKLAKCSTDTALRDIRELVEMGVLLQNPGGGRSTSYSLAAPPDRSE